MVQYIQRQPSFLEQMLSSGVQAYQQKRQQTQQGQALGNLAGLSEEQTKSLSRMSPEMQKVYIDNLTKSNIAEQKNLTSQSELQQLMQLMGMGGVQPTQQPTQQPMQEQGQGNLMQMLGSGEQEQIQEPIQQPVQQQRFNLGQSLGLEQPVQQPVQQPTQTPKRYTQDQINQATLINPNVGRAMQAQNDAIDRSKEQDKKGKAETYKTNLPVYKEAIDNMTKFESEIRSLDQMSEINKRDKLPKGLGRLNINWGTGEIRVPFLANTDTQRFAKLVNDFTTKAKDSYGARVTNFELERFLKRLPTLANSKEGRKQIIEQMSIMNELNLLREKTLKEVYDEHGLGGIDFQKANILADETMSKEKQKLIDRLNRIGGPKEKKKPGKKTTKEETGLPVADRAKTLDTLPTEGIKAGRTATQDDGTKWRFNGTAWEKI